MFLANWDERVRRRRADRRRETGREKLFAKSDRKNINIETTLAEKVRGQRRERNLSRLLGAYLVAQRNLLAAHRSVPFESPRGRYSVIESSIRRSDSIYTTGSGISRWNLVRKGSIECFVAKSERSPASRADLKLGSEIAEEVVLFNG